MDKTYWMCRRCGKHITHVQQIWQQCTCHPSKVQAVEVKKFEPAKGPKVPPMCKCCGCCK